MNSVVYNKFIDVWNHLKDEKDCFGYQEMMAEILNVKIQLPKRISKKSEYIFLNNASLIDSSFQECVGHSVGNILRSFNLGPDISYLEVLHDCAKNLKINYSDSLKENSLEELIAKEYLEKIWDNLDTHSKEKLKRELSSKLKEKGLDSVAGKILKGSSPFVILFASRTAGFSLYLGATTALSFVANSLGLSLSFGAYLGVSRAFAVALGPIGWAFTGIWAVYEFGSPNYTKKIIPSIVVLYAMRMSLNSDK